MSVEQRNALFGLVVPLGILALWQLLASGQTTPLFPAPGRSRWRSGRMPR